MSAFKYFIKLNGVSNGDAMYTPFTAQVSSTQDILNNTALLNGLFEFPESEKEMNETYFNKLSVPQQCDDDNCHGVCRSDFVEYYTKHPTLLEELLSNSYDDAQNTEIYAFDSLADANKWLVKEKWIEPIYCCDASLPKSLAC